MSIWTKKEFIAYLLIYASESDQTVTEEESAILKQKITDETFNKINAEIKGDNDYQRLQKVMAHIEHKSCTQEELNVTLSEIKDLYTADGHFDVMERTTLSFLQKLLKV